MKKILINLFFLFIYFTAFAQQTHGIKKLDGSIISAGYLTKILKHIIDTAHIMGLSVVIINDGKSVYNNTFGYRSKATNTLLEDTTEMYAASFTKPVSSYLFLKLVDKGVFSLDSPLVKYLKMPIENYEKWADLAKDNSFKLITPRMILSHSSGMPILRYLYHDKVNLIAEPGTKFYYSNEAMNLLGFMIEEYTGKKLNKLAEELIFKPLVMKHTSLIWELQFDKNYALGYGRSGDIIGMSKRTTAKAAGSMTTIASDYAKFVSVLMKKNGLSKYLFSEMMMKPQIKIISSKGFGPERDSLSFKYDKMQLSWGLGVGLFKSIYGKAFFHAGHDNGWQNYFVAYPDKKIAVILMSNSSNFEHAAAKILNLCIAEKYSPLEWLGYYDSND